MRDKQSVIKAKCDYATFLAFYKIEHGIASFALFFLFRCNVSSHVTQNVAIYQFRFVEKIRRQHILLQSLK